MPLGRRRPAGESTNGRRNRSVTPSLGTFPHPHMGEPVVPGTRTSSLTDYWLARMASSRSAKERELAPAMHAGSNGGKGVAVEVATGLA